MLRSRQLSMIAIGGSIGTGLFVASGNAIHLAGPAGALVAYGIIGIMVYFLMTSLGEMASLMPVSGSFNTYCTRFVDPALGFAMGVNYWYNWAITIAAELSAATLVMKFWLPNSPSMLWCGLFLVLMVFLNLLSVRYYGESEYWFSLIKVITVIAFIIIGTLIILGFIGGHDIGFSNWKIGGSPFHGGILTIFGVFVVAGFSFQGTELVGVAAGESEDPRRNVPKAIKTVFWRILLFNILSIAVISLLIPYTDSRLVNASLTNLAVSPFTIVFSMAGLKVAAAIMNFIILTAIISAGNSGMYASTRTLWQLSKEGKAPKMFGQLNHRGIPVNALLVTAAVGLVAFLASIYGDGAVYVWLLNASGLSGFIAWFGIAISHYRFRRAYVLQGRDLKDLPYRAKLFPFGPLFALAVCLLVILGQDYMAIVTGQFDLNGILVAYIGVPFFLVLWIGYKIKHKTKVVPLKECRFDMDPYHEHIDTIATEAADLEAVEAKG